jgi:hypothetical protein
VVLLQQVMINIRDSTLSLFRMTRNKNTIPVSMGKKRELGRRPSGLEQRLNGAGPFSLFIWR